MFRALHVLGRLGRPEPSMFRPVYLLRLRDGFVEQSSQHGAHTQPKDEGKKQTISHTKLSTASIRFVVCPICVGFRIVRALHAPRRSLLAPIDVVRA